MITRGRIRVKLRSIVKLVVKQSGQVNNSAEVATNQLGLSTSSSNLATMLEKILPLNQTVASDKAATNVMNVSTISVVDTISPLS